jgi:hypothetical protein
MPDIIAGQNYSGTIATNATDPNLADALNFTKVSGPAWLVVGPDGTLSGDPLAADVGTNHFVVSVTDPRSLSGSAALNINVTPPPPILATLAVSGTDLLLNWSGGIPPYQVQVSTDLTTSGWVNLGSPGNSITVSVTPSNAAAFYRILGQ